MTKHNVARLSCEPCPDGSKFTMRATLTSGAELVLSGKEAIDVFFTMTSAVMDAYNYDERTIH